MKEHNFLPGKIKKCQICNSNNLINVINIGDQALANSLILGKDIPFSLKYVLEPK